MPNVANFALFQVGWFASVLGAAEGRLWLGPITVVMILLIHLVRSPDARRELALLASIGALGFVLGSGLQALDVLHYAGRPAALICPLWVVGLWTLFATTFDRSFAWLRGRPRLAFALGLIGGPLSDLAGRRLGALEFGDDLAVSLVGSGVVWAVALPACLAIADRLPTTEVAS